MKKETKKEIGEYVLSAVEMLGISLLFSLFALIFLADKIPNAVKFVVGILFSVPIFWTTFTKGKRCGEALFKRSAKTTLSELHEEKGFQIPYYKCIFHVIGYVVPLTVLFVVAICLRSAGVRMAGMIFIFPYTLILYSVHAIDTKIVQPYSLPLFLLYVFAVAGMFIAGYLIGLYRLKRRHGEIENEIRMYDN